MKKIVFLAILLGCFTLQSCNKGDFNEIPFDLSIVRADISGAVALTLCSTDDATKAEGIENVSGLYKMDVNGNLFDVVFYLDVNSDHQLVETKSSKDLKISIKPTWIMPYGNDYILLGGCLAHFYGEYPSTWQGETIYDAINRFCHYCYNYGTEEYQNTPGYWYLLRKSDGKLFDVSLMMYHRDWQSRTFPSPYPNLSDIYALEDYARDPSTADSYQFTHVDLDKKGYIRSLGNELYVCSLDRVSIYEKPRGGFLSRVTNTREKLIVEEITNRNLNIGRGFVMNKDKMILTMTGQGMVIINPQGQMQSMSLSLWNTREDEWQYVVQVGNKWYAASCEYRWEDEKRWRECSLINPDGSLEKIVLTYANMSLEDSGDIDISYAPKFTDATSASFLVRWGDQLGSLTIDSTSDIITLSAFPADFPSDYEIYNAEGIAYVLSDDVRTITRYDLATSTSTSYAVDLSHIPSIVLPKQRYELATSTFYVTAYNNQDLISFYIDAETGAATLIGSSTTLKTTALVPLN